MKENMKKRLVWILLVLVGLANMRMAASAAENTQEAPKASFSVNIILPDNQRKETNAYYDLLMKAGQEQELELEVRNLSDQKKVIEAEVASAYTTAGGVVEYSKSEKTKPDDSLRYSMEDLVTTESRIEVEKEEAYTLKLMVKMPAEGVEGVLAGGITLREQEGEIEEQESGGAGMKIENKYSYAIALLLREKENEVVPELILNEVKASQFGGRNAFSGNLQNIQPAYLNDMKAQVWVTKKGESEKLYEYNDSDMQMAPNSNFNYFIPLNGEKYVAGDYTFTAEIEGSGEKWLLTRDFTVTADEAKALNAADLSIEENNLWIFIAIGAGILLIMITALFVTRSRKKKRAMHLRMMRQRQRQAQRR